jgi:hypothetical protein
LEVNKTLLYIHFCYDDQCINHYSLKGLHFMIHDGYFDDAFILHDPTGGSFHWQTILHYMISNSKKSSDSLNTNAEVIDFLKNKVVNEVDSEKIHLDLFPRSLLNFKSIIL